MNKKTILIIAVFLLICVVGALWVTGRGAQEPVSTLPAVSEPSGSGTPANPGPASAFPEPDSTFPEPVEGDEDDIEWDYSTFPDDYAFRSKKLLNEHYEKHGIEMDFESAEAYAESANLVIHHPDVLWKIEKDDGDYVFYLEETNEFVVLSKDGYIRTYFWPDSGRKYYDKQ